MQDTQGWTITDGGKDCASLSPVVSAATGIEENGFYANWNAVSGAEGYRLDVATDEAFTNFVSGYRDRDVGDATAFRVTGLSPGVEYFYRVRVRYDGEARANSDTVAVVTAADSAAVSALDATAADSAAVSALDATAADSAAVSALDATAAAPADVPALDANGTFLLGLLTTAAGVAFIRRRRKSE